MSQLLSVSNTLLSMRGRMPITHENGALLYETVGCDYTEATKVNIRGLLWLVVGLEMGPFKTK